MKQSLLTLIARLKDGNKRGKRERERGHTEVYAGQKASNTGINL